MLAGIPFGKKEENHNLFIFLIDAIAIMGDQHVSSLANACGNMMCFLFHINHSCDKIDYPIPLFLTVQNVGIENKLYEKFNASCGNCEALAIW